jgi:histidinol-phosphate/aromatic aminotransferase/cobyric acid decarboxylase-like protein/imidazoleglycerol phosphate dehydratase HisB
MRTLPSGFKSYTWAPSDAEIARIAGVDPIEVLRFDGNVPATPLPAARPSAVATAVANVNSYPHGGYGALKQAIASYAGVDVQNVVLGAGSDDLILLCARSFSGPGGSISIGNDPTYPMFDIARSLAGADEGEAGAADITFFCRPNNPTGTLDDLPAVRPLVVDEAYFEYCGETAVGLLDEGVVVLRTLSKAFGLAGARVGYALASRDVAAELNARQSPAPISTLSAALALAVLADPPDVKPQIAERERLAEGLRALGFEPAASFTNFVFVPVPGPATLRDRLYERGLAVRAVEGGIRISVRDETDDDTLLAALAEIERRTTPHSAPTSVRRARHARTTTETTISVLLQLEGSGRIRVETGAGLYDHLLEQLGFHAGFDLIVTGRGDIENGVHHVVEDTAIAVGQALDRALGDRRGISRYGDAAVPMDDALANATVDLGGRPWAELDIATEPGLATHWFTTFSQNARLGLHLKATGRDPHHTAEASFKAVGRCLASAVALSDGAIPSTKGVL